MRILRVIASVDPATGGPVAGLRAITPALARLGHTSDFLTVDDPMAGYLQSFVGPVHALGPAKGGYSYAPRFRRWLEKNARQYDAIVVHGLWQYLGRTVRAVTAAGGPPYFVFPHGMLDPTLRETYPMKHVKKWLYWISVERRVIRDARAVFFTCEEERRLARTTFPFYQASERVVAYGTAAPDGDPADWQNAWRKRFPALTDRRYFLFLGRLHSKKGVDLLLRAYGRVTRERAAAQNGPTPDLVLAGPCLDPRYLAELHALAKAQGVADQVHWTGMLTGDAKWGALRNAEAFVLPSRQENFGIAVVEALASSTPVLLSDRVNIWREILADNAALVEPANEEGTARLFHRWLLLDPAARTRMSAAAKVCFEQRFEVAHAAQNLSEQLSSLIGPRVSAA